MREFTLCRATPPCSGRCPPAPRAHPPAPRRPPGAGMSSPSFLQRGAEGSTQSLSEHRHHAGASQAPRTQRTGAAQTGKQAPGAGGWFIGESLPWIAVVLFAYASAVYAGMAFTRASRTCRRGIEHASAQSGYNERAQSSPTRRRKDLENTEVTMPQRTSTESHQGHLRDPDARRRIPRRVYS